MKQSIMFIAIILGMIAISCETPDIIPSDTGTWNLLIKNNSDDVVDLKYIDNTIADFPIKGDTAFLSLFPGQTVIIPYEDHISESTVDGFWINFRYWRKANGVYPSNSHSKQVYYNKENTITYE